MLVLRWKQGHIIGFWADPKGTLGAPKGTLGAPKGTLGVPKGTVPFGKA